MEKTIVTIILTPEQITQELQELPGWSYTNEKISKEFSFADFMDSLNFINQLAPYCESLDHHPDILWQYNKIRFDLQRFDIGGKVTNKDILVARHIEELYSKKK